MRPVKNKIGILILLFLVATALLSISPVPVEATSTGTTMYFNIGYVSPTPEPGRGSAHSREWSEKLEEKIEEELEEECSTDTDCSPTMYCISGGCKKIICDCGYIENHACHHHECCDNADCNDPLYQKCVDNFCVMKAYNLALIGDMVVDEEATLILYENGGVATDILIKIRLPDGTTIEGYTDEEGKFAFTPTMVGDYEAKAWSIDGKILSIAPKSAAKQSIMLEPMSFEQCCAFGKCGNMLGICWFWYVAIVLLVPIFFVYKGINFMLKRRKQTSRKKEIMKMMKKVK